MTRTFQPFVMERMMSKWENVVQYNLSESGVHPMTLRELVNNEEDLERFHNIPITYPQANGVIELRENIGLLYPGSSPDNILVTVGCIEANYISLLTLLEPGDEIALLLPNYMQLWGVAKNMGLTIRELHLDENKGWALEDGWEKAVTENTKLIAVCNPNNPTGYILTEEEMDAIVAAAERVGAWLLADEVYTGAERIRETETLSFWGRYDKVLANGSLSKAYGIPGLRIGWTVGPADTVDAMWARHEYLTISSGMLANHIGAYALSPDIRPKLIRRTREYIRSGYPILEEYMNSHPGVFSIVPPQAAAIAFPRYHLDSNSTALVERLIKEKSVLIAPGDHFGMDHHLRISYGLQPEYLRTGLDRILELIEELN